MRVIAIKAAAQSVCGSLTQTSKMPCKSYSLPTEACKTGFKMAKQAGSVCADCYADRGLYAVFANRVKPAQFARLDSLTDPRWVESIVALIDDDDYFRWHDAGDLQGLWHLENIARVAQLTPRTKHWLPTREYAVVKNYIAKHGSLPKNLMVRLSAMYPDKVALVPASLKGVKNITTSNVHTIKPLGKECIAPTQGGECRDCRACWGSSVISYKLH
jgi:hypothetical protein